MKWLLLYCSVVLSLENQITVLKRSTWDDSLNRNKFVLVEFFSQGCHHCIAFAPQYEAAARRLWHHDGLLVAKVDGSVEKGLATDYKVEGFPTVLLIRQGESAGEPEASMFSHCMQHMKSLCRHLRFACQ